MLQREVVDNPVKGKILKAFKVKRDGKALDVVAADSKKEPARPAKLGPNTFYGAVVDLAELAEPQLLLWRSE